MLLQKNVLRTMSNKGLKSALLKQGILGMNVVAGFGMFVFWLFEYTGFI